MRRVVAGAIGLLVVGFGVVLTLQTLGYLQGERAEVWSVIGPLIAGLGVALVIVAVRGPR